MKHLAVAVAVVLVVISAMSAFGAVREFDKIKVNVPKGWEAIDDGSWVTLRKKKGSAEMLIIVESREGKSLDRLAKEIAKQYGSRDMEDIEDYYVFTYKEDGIESFGRLSEAKRGQYLLVLMTPHSKTDEMADIEETIVVK